MNENFNPKNKADYRKRDNFINKKLKEKISFDNS